MYFRIKFFFFTVCIILSSCHRHKWQNARTTPVIVKKDTSTCTFAIIGDYGGNTDAELAVSNMVKSWHPDFIITVGDNIYGGCCDFDTNIGKYYGDYIYNPEAPKRERCHGHSDSIKENRFFPCLGNHDQSPAHPLLTQYLKYFTHLPGNGINYDFVWGPVHFFSLFSEEGEDWKPRLDENALDTMKEKIWRDKADASVKFHLVYFHHPPYTSNSRSGDSTVRKDFKSMGIDAVLCGHYHDYERITDESCFPYLVVGCSGEELDKASGPKNGLDKMPGLADEKLVMEKYGAVKAVATADGIRFTFYSVTDTVHAADSFSIIRKK